MGRSEELGTGLRRVYKYSKVYSGSQNIIFQEEDIFTQQIPLDEKMMYEKSDNVIESTDEENNAGGAIGGAIEENVLTKRQIEILDILKKQPDMSYRNLSKHLNINESAILKHLMILKDKGIIKRTGGTRGYWDIIIKYQ